MNEELFSKLANELDAIRLRVQRLEAQETTPSAIAATASTLAKRDTSGGISAVGVGTARSSGTALFALDATINGSSLTLANNATATPFGNAINFSGLVIVNDTATDGAVALYLTGGCVAPALVAQTLAIFSSVAATASKINLYLVSSVITIENKTGVSRTLNIVGIRSRNFQ
jgi:hypothetical protein